MNRAPTPPLAAAGGRPYRRGSGIASPALRPFCRIEEGAGLVVLQNKGEHGPGGLADGVPVQAGHSTVSIVEELCDAPLNTHATRRPPPLSLAETLKQALLAAAIGQCNLPGTGYVTLPAVLTSHLRFLLA